MQIGLNTLAIEAEDGPGNVSTLSINVTRQIDDVPPAISDVAVNPLSGSPGQLFDLSATIIDAWSGLDPASVVFEIEHPDGTVLETLAPFQIGDIFTAQWDSALAISEGVYYLDVLAADLNGNQAQANNAGTFFIGDDPQLSLDKIDPLLPTNLDPIVIDVTVTDMSPIVGATLTYQHELSPSAMPVNLLAQGGGVWRGTIPKQLKGQVELNIGATDGFGNTSAIGPFFIDVEDVSLPVFSGWQFAPPDITEHTLGSVLFQVTITDIGGGYVDQTPGFDFTFGAESYDGYESMTDEGDSVWSYLLTGVDWDARQGQTLKFKVTAIDDSANIGTSQEQQEVIVAVNDRPVILDATPSYSPVFVAPPDCRAFNITASDEETSVLDISWYLDSVLVGTGSEYAYCAVGVGTYVLHTKVSDGELSAIASWDILPYAPLDSPSSLGVTSESPMQLNLIWQDKSSDETSFHIERSPDGSTGWMEIASVGVDVESYQDFHPRLRHGIFLSCSLPSEQRRPVFRILRIRWCYNACLSIPRN